jgi:flagellar basal body-associated protein FliL
MVEKQPVSKRKSFKISKGTIIIISILIAIFAIVNFLVFPILFKTQVSPEQVQLPIINRGDAAFVNSELSKRALVVPTLVAPNNAIGKQNPFE